LPIGRKQLKHLSGVSGKRSKQAPGRYAEPGWQGLRTENVNAGRDGFVAIDDANGCRTHA